MDPDLATDVCDTLLGRREWARQQPTHHPAKRIGMTHVAMFDVQQFDRTLLPARAGAAPGCGDRFEDAAATTAAATVLASVIHRPSAIVAALSA